MDSAFMSLAIGGWCKSSCCPRLYILVLSFTRRSIGGPIYKQGVSYKPVQTIRITLGTFFLHT